MGTRKRERCKRPACVGSKREAKLLRAKMLEYHDELIEVSRALDKAGAPWILNPAVDGRPGMTRVERIEAMVKLGVEKARQLRAELAAARGPIVDAVPGGV